MIDSISQEYENLKGFVDDVNSLRQRTWNGSFYQSDRPSPSKPRKEERVRDLIDTYYPYLCFPKTAGGLQGLSNLPFSQLELFFNEAYRRAVSRMKQLEK